MPGNVLYRLLDEQSLLSRLLSSTSPEDAWAEFLRRYSNLFFKVIWQQERDHDAAVEKYLFVCTKFAENNFARLRKFRTDYGTRAPKLSTWLVTVTHNLCIDAHRSAHGRRRYPAALLTMSELDRTVFRLHYWEGNSAEEIHQMLTERANGESTPDILERIQNAIGDRQQRPAPEFVRFDPDLHFDVPSEERDDFVGEESEWLSAIEARERVVVRLRFWEGLSAKEIVDILNLRSTQQVHSIMHSALKKLRAHASHRKEQAPDVREIRSRPNGNASHGS